jgi:hypothetical protein
MMLSSTEAGTFPHDYFSLLPSEEHTEFSLNTFAGKHLFPKFIRFDV